MIKNGYVIFIKKMYEYVDRSVLTQKRIFEVSTLSGFKVNVQFLFCNSV